MAFDPNEPRDKAGQWTAGGSGKPTELSAQQLSALKSLKGKTGWDIDVAVNPSENDLMRMARQDQHGALRLLTAKDGNVYACGATNCTHNILLSQILRIGPDDIVASEHRKLVGGKWVKTVAGQLLDSSGDTQRKLADINRANHAAWKR